MSILKVEYMVAIFFQISFLLVPKTEICQKNSPKQPLTPLQILVELKSKPVCSKGLMSLYLRQLIAPPDFQIFRRF